MPASRILLGVFIAFYDRRTTPHLQRTVRICGCTLGCLRSGSVECGTTGRSVCLDDGSQSISAKQRMGPHHAKSAFICLQRGHEETRKIQSSLAQSRMHASQTMTNLRGTYIYINVTIVTQRFDDESGLFPNSMVQKLIGRPDDRRALLYLCVSFHPAVFLVFLEHTWTNQSLTVSAGSKLCGRTSSRSICLWILKTIISRLAPSSWLYDTSVESFEM